MSHASDVRSTSHDRHDPMLVAALAAGDLAGTDRDQAIALTRTCTDCATLHDDLQALARATAAAPPPIATRPRDFRLTPADAARLRPSGWRRFVAAVSSSRTIVSRPLGAGLATLGLVGLLIGNVSIGGSTASAPLQETGNAAGGARAAASVLTADAATSASAGPGGAPVAAPLPSAAAASTDPRYSSASHGGGASPSGVPGIVQGGVPVEPPLGPSAAASAPAGELFAAREPASNEPLRPLNVLFGAAVVIGLVLLVASWRRGRQTA